MRFCKILSYSDEGILVTHLPLLFGILVGGAVCRLLWNAGLKYPGTLIGVFFVGMTLTFIPGNLVMSNFSDESVNNRRLKDIGEALTSYFAANGTYPADLGSLIPEHLERENEGALLMKGGKGLIWGYVPASRYKTRRPSQVILYGPVLAKGRGIVLHRDGLIARYPAEKYRALLSVALGDAQLAP